MDSAQQPPFHFVASIRHGERGDFANENNKAQIFDQAQQNPVDPPLTKPGIEQAKMTGKYLARMFQQWGIQNNVILIRSSPFARTLMTATYIAQELGVQVVETSSVLSEYLGSFMFQQNPMPLLDIKNLPMKDFRAQYLIPESVRIDTEKDNFEKEANKYYPESKQMGAIRAFIGIDYSIDTQMQAAAKNNARGLTILNITHCLQVGWMANVDEIFGRAFLKQNLKHPYAIKAQSQISREDLKTFSEIIGDLAKSKDANGRGHLDSNSMEKMYRIMSKCEQGFAEYCGISGGMVQYNVGPNGEPSIANFIELLRQEYMHTKE